MAARATATARNRSGVPQGWRPAGPRTGGSSRTLLVVAVTSVVAAVVAIAALLLASGNTSRQAVPTALPATSMATALTVDGQAIPLRELMLQVAADRAATFAYFQQHYQARDSKGFWNTRFGGTTPAEYLTAHAVADTVTVAVQRRLAHQHGLLADAGYPAYLQSWTTENARRTAALAKHEVIYGPTQYSESGYFTYVMGDLVPRLEQALTADGSITVADADVKAYYLAHPEKFPGAAGQSSFQAVKEQARQLYLDERFRAYVASVAARATVVRSDDVLARIPLG